MGHCGTTFNFFETKLVRRGMRFELLLLPKGKFHDQGDAKWVVIRGQLRGHNDTPFEQPTPVWPIGRPGVAHLQSVFGGLINDILFLHYPLIMEFTS
jgi:hypothetical protein